MRVEWKGRRVDLSLPQIGLAECYCCGRFGKAVCVYDDRQHEHWCTDCVPSGVLVIAALKE